MFIFPTLPPKNDCNSKPKTNKNGYLQLKHMVSGKVKKLMLDKSSVILPIPSVDETSEAQKSEVE